MHSHNNNQVSIAINPHVITYVQNQITNNYNMNTNEIILDG